MIDKKEEATYLLPVTMEVSHDDLWSLNEAGQFLEHLVEHQVQNCMLVII